jgi:hypothetical protein
MPEGENSEAACENTAKNVITKSSTCAKPSQDAKPV